jgi:hypothetical protein
MGDFLRVDQGLQERGGVVEVKEFRSGSAIVGCRSRGHLPQELDDPLPTASDPAGRC